MVDVFDRAVIMISFASTARPSLGFMGSKGIGLRGGGHTPREARPEGAELHEHCEERAGLTGGEPDSQRSPPEKPLGGH